MWMSRFRHQQCHFDIIYIIYTNYILHRSKRKMNRLHNKHKHTNKKRTYKSNKDIQKTLKSRRCRRGRTNKKGGSKGCLSCLSCFRGNGVHSSSKTERINNEIKQLYIYTIYNGILYLHTGEGQYLTTFNTYKNKLTAHIDYLNDGVPVPNESEKASIDERRLKSHVVDLDSNLMTTHGHGYNAPISGATPTNRPIIRSAFDKVKAAASSDQPPFNNLKALLDEYVKDVIGAGSVGQAGGHSNKQ